MHVTLDQFIKIFTLGGPGVGVALDRGLQKVLDLVRGNVGHFIILLIDDVGINVRRQCFFVCHRRDNELSRRRQLRPYLELSIKNR